MKKLLGIVILLVLTVQLNAQRGDIEFTGYGGYTFKNSFAIYGGEATIGDGFTYGGSLAFGVSDDLDVEFYYSRQESDMSAFSVLPPAFSERGDGNVSYWMLGGVKNFQAMNPNLYFYGAFRLGGVTFAGPNNSESKFASSFGGGVKYFVNDKVGIKMAANVLFPIFDVGASLWFGTGGSGVGVSTWSPIVQFNLQGGVFFRLSK